MAYPPPLARRTGSHPSHSFLIRTFPSDHPHLATPHQAGLDRLDATANLLQRGAKSDAQQEEEANFRALAAPLRAGLQAQVSRGAAPLADSTAQTMYQMKAVTKSKLMGGAGKVEVVRRRRVRKAQQEHVKRCGTVEHAFSY